MDHLMRQIAELSRIVEIGKHQLDNLLAKIHDLEIENQRLRDQLAFRVTQYDEVVGMNQGLVHMVETLEADNKNLKVRVARNVERIRRMEEGEL